MKLYRIFYFEDFPIKIYDLKFAISTFLQSTEEKFIDKQNQE